MKFIKQNKQNTAIVELSDIVEGIAADTTLSKQTVETVLFSLKEQMIYYCQSAMNGADENEKYIIRLFPHFYVKIGMTKPHEKILNGRTIHIPSRIRAVPRFTRYFNRKIINNLKDG